MISKFRRDLKRVFDLTIRNDRIKINILQALPFWIASLITGFVSVAYSKLFNYAEIASKYVLGIHFWLIFIIAPACFVAGWFVVKEFAPNAKGSGIPQIMAAIDLAVPRHNEKVNRLLNLKIILTKVVSSLIMVFGGGIIGREGPTIQIAGSIFRKVNEWIPDNWPKVSKRNMIMTGAAAGLAAAFNTPLGGVVFAVEELAKTHIRFFRTALFTAVIIAGLTAQGMLGPYLYLGYPNVKNLSVYIFFGVVLTAILSSICGSLMSKWILRIMRWKSKRNTSKQTIIFLVGGALMIAFLAYFISPKILGSGKELMTNVLFTNNKYEAWYIGLLKMFGIMVSFTSGAAGGVFAPSLSAGASIGAFIAGLFHVIGSNANILILSGMVGFLTGVTRAPFTSAILVLEMTDRHNVIFHLLVAGMVASLVGMLVDKHSLYEHLKLQYYKEALQAEASEPVNIEKEEP